MGRYLAYRGRPNVLKNQKVSQADINQYIFVCMRFRFLTLRQIDTYWAMCCVYKLVGMKLPEFRLFKSEVFLSVCSVLSLLSRVNCRGDLQVWNSTRSDNASRHLSHDTISARRLVSCPLGTIETGSQSTGVFLCWINDHVAKYDGARQLFLLGANF